MSGHSNNIIQHSFIMENKHYVFLLVDTNVETRDQKLLKTLSGLKMHNKHHK